MRSLGPADPATVAGHRLLGRLGEGGMGVVYLARSPGAALVALKVVHADFARDEGFRDRFRREVETLSRVRNPWIVPLLAADPDAPAPWLATAFVAGPSLAEAVAAHGPLPQPTLRVLGARLAGALRDVHDAGLVHRDVKPGNVLLALDGPRLIDFGIAREPGDTSLTATGVVVGTPGFLAPEQIDGAGRAEVGPPADIFALGCVLAYAATGRPPFGTGPVDALLFRAVHESADLDGVPAGVAPTLRACLEKSAELRPGARDLLRSLDPSGAEDGAPAASGPRPPDGGAEVGGEETSWLPERVTRLVAARAAEGAALPDIAPTEVDANPVPQAPAPADPASRSPAPDGAGTAPDAERGPGGADPLGVPEARRPDGRPPRRRFLLLAGGAVAVAAGGAALGWRGDRETPGPAATGEPGHTLGLQADLTGSGKSVGLAQERGVRLAVDEFNARPDVPFPLALEVRDDAGDPGRSAAVAEEFVADPSVVAVIGPTGDAEAATALPVYDRALLPVVTVSAGAVKLLVLGARSFAQATPGDSQLPFFLTAHLRDAARSGTVGVVYDRSAGDHGWEVTGVLSRVLDRYQRPFVPKVISSLRVDLGPTVEELLAEEVDAVVFAGPPDRAGRLAEALGVRGFDGPRMGFDPLLDPRFLTAAGQAAEGWVIVAPALDPETHASGRPFAAAHRKRFGAQAAPFAAEAYDATGLVLHALAELPARRRERGDLATAIRTTTYEGVTQELSFTPDNGARTLDQTGVYLWTVEDGRFRCLGPAPFGPPV
ncbi:bifunctional serine/threonine-protein kinase/ABC transporter substrate-binding protein [Streptomyces sp. HSG2]|uniref:bifunctional serine/threonine-protein kinase/ABC transporter substrate-binding protein n=1 Tax=Streptomyces sp. HSG2 TaxID=2797167 RepID=UPI00190355E5|nr:bifunctional serine/threonine-protein kinase/ABC transporter substrate-binding protein [Streptomyces sp. HSG2]